MLYECDEQGTRRRTGRHVCFRRRARGRRLRAQAGAEDRGRAGGRAAGDADDGRGVSIVQRRFRPARHRSHAALCVPHEGRGQALPGQGRLRRGLHQRRKRARGDATRAAAARFLAGPLLGATRHLRLPRLPARENRGARTARRGARAALRRLTRAMDESFADPAAVCATLAPLLLDDRRARIDAAAAARLGGLRRGIENLHEPHNGAAVLRSAEAFGIQRVDVIESVEPFRFSSTVTQGCEKWLDVVHHPTLADAVRALRADGFVLYAAVPGAAATVDDLDFGRPAAVMIGNEHAGLGGEAVAAADARFGVPMLGMTRSLNLSVAAALIVERAAQVRRRALGRPGDLDADAGLVLRARFYAASVRGADVILARATGR